MKEERANDGDDSTNERKKNERVHFNKKTTTTTTETAEQNDLSTLSHTRSCVQFLLLCLTLFYNIPFSGLGWSLPQSTMSLIFCHWLKIALRLWVNVTKAISHPLTFSHAGHFGKETLTISRIEKVFRLNFKLHSAHCAMCIMLFIAVIWFSV